MIADAHMIYAEIVQLNKIILEHKRNNDFWRVLHEAHLDDKKLQITKSDMRTWNGHNRHIRRMMKRNDRAIKRYKNRVEWLKYVYKRVTGNEHEDDE